MHRSPLAPLALILALSGCAAEQMPSPARLAEADARLMREPTCPEPVQSGADARSELARLRKQCSDDVARFRDIQSHVRKASEPPSVVATK